MGPAAVIFLAAWLNSARLVGLIAYLFAAISCGIALGEARRDPRGKRLAEILLAFESGLFLDIAFSIRWQLHDLLEYEAIRNHLYSERAGPQIAALVFLCLAAAVGIGIALHRLRGRVAATVAVSGAILSLSCWCTEVISLHATDAVLYRRVDGVMLVSLCWIAFSLMTGLGILLDAREARSEAVQRAISATKANSSLTDS
jgi:hypothetical protein